MPLDSNATPCDVQFVNPETGEEQWLTIYVEDYFSLSPDELFTFLNDEASHILQDSKFAELGLIDASVLLTGDYVCTTEEP